MNDESGHESARRIDAHEANVLAQELNNQALGVSEPVVEVPTENRQGGEAVDSTPGIMESGEASVFPPDIDGDATVGGDPESRAVLREEESR